MIMAIGHRTKSQTATPFVVRLLTLIAAVSLVFNAAGSIALAQSVPSERQILDALRPKAKTRSFSFSPSAGAPDGASQKKLLDGLRTRSARSITIEEREKVAEIAKSRPNIDLEINFEFNSAIVGSKAVPTLLALGRALSAAEMRNSIFVINGHTDAKGSAEYNQDLSERRAEAVKKLLVEQFGIPISSLIAVGFGKSMLKNPADPFGGENRRVQIVNTEQKAAVNR